MLISFECKCYTRKNIIHKWKRRILHEHQSAPKMPLGVCKRAFASFLIISIYCSCDFKTINVMYNTTNTLLLSQNNCWNMPEEVISSWTRVSSSSLKQLLLSWQLTHSGLPKVYPRNRVKEQMWSKKLLLCHYEHVLHIHTAEVDVFMITSLILLLSCL